VQKRTDATMKMANVTGDSATDVSSYMTAIWNNFAEGSDNLEYFADVITKLGAETAASSAEIAGGLEKFAAIGETVGLSYEYATAALTTIIDKTRQSEDVVGTALKTIFARIQGLKLGETLEDGVDLNKYSEALQSVGISIFDQAGELRDMDLILEDMGSKWDDLSKAQQVALAQTVGGVRQYNQLISLMDNWDSM
jgi:TP901 family phage tail tape measure protein